VPIHPEVAQALEQWLRQEPEPAFGVDRSKLMERMPRRVEIEVKSDIGPALEHVATVAAQVPDQVRAELGNSKIFFWQGFFDGVITMALLMMVVLLWGRFGRRNA
jgi:hypothetical protein